MNFSDDNPAMAESELNIAAAGAVLACEAGVPYQPPSGNDSGVDPIAEWVANQRQLDFDHPVAVNFLDEAAYREAITGGEPVDAEITEEEEQAEADALAQFRALGFISGDVDLGEASDTLSGSGGDSGSGGSGWQR